MQELSYYIFTTEITHLSSHIFDWLSEQKTCKYFLSALTLILVIHKLYVLVISTKICVRCKCVVTKCYLLENYAILMIRVLGVSRKKLVRNPEQEHHNSHYNIFLHHQIWRLIILLEHIWIETGACLIVCTDND